MATNLVDRAWMNVSGTPGTGNITLGSVVAGNQSFTDAGVTDATPIPYVVFDGNDWEEGIGQSSSSVTVWQRTTVSRSVISGTAGTTKLTLTSSAQVFLTARATDLADASLFKTGTVAAARLPLGTSANQVPQLDSGGHLVAAVLGAQSIGTNGYVTLPGGLIIQWGFQSTTGANTTFPLTFPTNVFSVSATKQQSPAVGTQTQSFLVVTASTSGFTVDTSPGNASKTAYYWMAIGN
jgi:hypothetical protein